MKFVIQRVTEASCTVDGNVTGAIQKGFLVLIGIADTDTTAIADKMIKKLLGLRIFEDADGKTNLSLADVGGSLLLISQFTLYADCRKGNRPSFVRAGKPEMASRMYDYIVARCKEQIPDTGCGIFGADMKISLLNDGPFTILPGFRRNLLNETTQRMILHTGLHCGISLWLRNIRHSVKQLNGCFMVETIR